MRGDLRAELEAVLDTALLAEAKAAGEPKDLHYRRMKPKAKLFDPTRPGLIARKGADGEIVWMYRYRRIDSPAQVELRLGKTPEMSLAEARKAWRPLREQRLKGVEPKIEAARVEMTVGQLMDLYLRDYVAVAQSAGTKKTVTFLLEKFLRPHADTLVCAFGPAQARAVLEPLISTGRLVSAGQVKTACSTMWTVGLTGGTRRHQVGEPWLDAERITNPWPLAVVPAVVADTYVPRDLAEMRRAVRAIAAMGEAGDVAWLQALTGLRINEVCGLRISEIDEEAKTLTIPASRMKANVAHRVMLSRAAWEVIERRMEMAREDGRDHLFPAARDPSRVLSTNAAQKIFAGVVAAGQLHPKFTSHAWRRALGTWAMEHGAVKDVRDRLLAHRESGIDAHYSMAALDAPAREWWAKWANFLVGLKAEDNRRTDEATWE